MPKATEQWIPTRLGEYCEFGILHLALFRDAHLSDQAWSLYLYPRKGVRLGRYDSESRLAEIEFVSPSHASAKRDALSVAVDWLGMNLERVLRARAATPAKVRRLWPKKERHGRWGFEPSELVFLLTRMLPELCTRDFAIGQVMAAFDLHEKKRKN